MDTSKLKPNDPRVQYLTATIRGKTYSYILGEPQGKKVDTIVLVHGWPDLAFGWRHQIPYLMSLGFQVIAPNMVGYAGTDAPEDLRQWTYKSVSADINELARKYVGDGQIILGGHDWGGAVVWRTAFLYPELIKAVFAVCTPFIGPPKNFTSLDDAVAAGRMLNLKYQLQLKGPEVQGRIQGKDMLRGFFKAIFGGRDSNGELGFSGADGFHFDRLDSLDHPDWLMSPEELEHYIDQYSLQKAPELRGPLNWYRTQRLNFEEEQDLANNGPKIRFEMPALFIAASRDKALPPAMSVGMENSFANLARAEVDATHWALAEVPDEVNAQVGKWLDETLNGAIKAAL